MAEAHAGSPSLDLRERGAERDGQPQAMDRRLFMQLMVFDCAGDVPVREMIKNLGTLLTAGHVPSVIYEDVNNPSGVGFLTWSEQPLDFATKAREVFAQPEVKGLKLVREFTMLGRTYSTGYEQDLEYWLLKRPAETVLNEAWPWAVWYPLRRGGAFEKLEPREKGSIMREHGTIGKAYGAADLAHDVRLACHGLDANDNEFVIGLIGKELHPLSHVVQAMRATRQTSEFIVQMGPFFVGRAVFRNAG
jgi:chlorite dismutase